MLIAHPRVIWNSLMGDMVLELPGKGLSIVELGRGVAQLTTRSA